MLDQTFLKEIDQVKNNLKQKFQNEKNEDLKLELMEQFERLHNSFLDLASELKGFTKDLNTSKRYCTFNNELINNK